MIADGDVIRILGRFAEDGEALYRNLTFCNPMKIQTFDDMPSRSCLAYNFGYLLSTRKESNLIEFTYRLP